TTGEQNPKQNSPQKIQFLNVCSGNSLEKSTVKMGRLTKLILGLWSKSANGEWRFEETSAYHGECVVINKNESLEGLLELIRIRLDLGILTPVALTYQLPDWMNLPGGAKTPPINLLTDKDVEIMTSVEDYMAEAVLFVTSDTIYLGEEVTEAQHRQAIRDLVGSHPIVCSKHILEIMFNEPQLLIVFRVALEIEMVYGLPNDEGETQDQAQFQRLTVDDIISMDGDGSMSPEDLTYFNPYEEAEILHLSTPLEVQPLRIWRDITQEYLYLDDMMDEEDSYEVYVGESPHENQGVLGLPLAANRRVSAPQPATIIIIDEDDDSSTTDSSDGINHNNNISNATPTQVNKPNSTDVQDNTPSFIKGDSSAGLETDSCKDVNMITPAAPEKGTDAEPCLELTLGVGNKTSVVAQVPLGTLDDSSSESDETCGKDFTSRADFKQQLDMQNKQHILLLEKCSSQDLLINDLEFDVKEKNGSSYHVNLCTKSCTCFSFQSLLIPCPHAIAAAIKEKKSIEELVSSFYTVATLASAYADNILPISNNVNSSEVKINGEGEEVAIFPPASKRPPGRPRKTRILSTGEIRMKTPRRRRHVCSRCKGRGHNKATCKVAI
ncbi:hypothetical protein HID58_025548, partial [Brassica napus]